MQMIMKNGKLNKRTARSRLPVVALLSLVVVAGVFWWLKLVGVAMAGEAFCGYEEHVHSDACLVKTLVCTLDENAEHTHTDSCYEMRCSLGKEEHIHTAACYSDLTADVETPDVWEATLEQAELTGEAGHDLAAIAQTQLGYTESVHNYVLNEDGTRRGYTRYGEWYGNTHGNWSAMFAAFCMHYAGITSDLAPYNTGTNAMMLAWTDRGLFREASDSPRVGDLVFLDAAGAGTCTDVGIVCAVDDSIDAIQGDSNDRVETCTYDRSDARILGYGSIAGVIEQSLSDADRARVANVNARIAALPTEDDVLAQMEKYDPDSDAFANWYRTLSLDVMTTYAYYEDLEPTLQVLIDDPEKLDALSWTWQATTMSNRVVSSIDVYQANIYTNALTTVVYGGSVKDVLNSGMAFSSWDAIIIEKIGNELQVSAVYANNLESKQSLKATTSEGFVLLVRQGSTDYAKIADVRVGQYVAVDSAGFYQTKNASTNTIGTITFSADPVHNSNLTIVEGADTRDLIEVNLYDYGSNINDPYKRNSKYPGFQQDGGTSSVTSLGPFAMNFGNNITADLATKISNVTTNNPSAINQTVNGANGSVTGAMSTTLKDGYPALKDGTSLAYLFSDNTYATKKNRNNINGLFQYNSQTGAYTFNSRRNHAQFDAATDSFVLYKQLITSNFLMYPFGNFLPFNDITTQTTQTTVITRSWFLQTASDALNKYNSGAGGAYQTLSNVLTSYVSQMDQKYGTGWGYNEAIETYFGLNGITFNPPPGISKEDYLGLVYSIDYDEATDFFFGMDMHMEFMQPKNGLTGLDGQQPMVFDFIGDDDVWLYIDGKLMLDLSGIHRHVSGRVDFTEGKVYYYDLNPETGQADKLSRVQTFAEILGSSDELNENGTFANYTTHTLDFYYMERGAGSGVCEMNFNLPLVRENHIAVTKELDSLESGVLGDPDFCFQIFKEGDNELLIGPGTAYAVCDSNGNRIGSGITGENGVFAIKANQTAVFEHVPENAGRYFVRELLDTDVYEQYGTVTVDGNSVTTDSYTDLTIDSDTFKGISSPVKDISDGSTSFCFVNHIDTSKYGGLEISKILKEYTADPTEKDFTFLLEIDGVPIPAGTQYEQIDSDGHVTAAQITEAGKLTIRSGQAVRLNRILAGSVITLRESDESASGYVVTYQGESIRLTENAAGGVSGVIPSDAMSAIRVTNDQSGTKLSIPAKKSLLYPDGSEKTYSFLLREIVSPDDPSILPDGKSVRSTVSLSSGQADFAFVLNYPPDVSTAGLHYYTITEEGASTENGMDTGCYIVAVNITMTDGKANAAIIDIRKNGESVDTISFTNANVRSLTVTKTVKNTVGCETSFRFDLTATVGGTPVSGVFPCNAPDGQTEISFENGAASVYLKDGQQLTIYGLPYGTAWTVQEVPTASFFTECGSSTAERCVGSDVGGTLTDDETAFFVNIYGVELPATGSYGTLLFTIGGLLLMVSALISGCILRHKRERRSK